MKENPFKYAGILLCSLFLTFSLTACGGGGSDDNDDNSSPQTGSETDEMVVLKGTAATGAPISGSVDVINANGEMAGNPVTIGADGSFTISVSAGSPYLLEVTDQDGNALYSYAVSGGTVNVTPLTNLAVVIANNGQQPSNLFTNWGTSQLSQQEIEEAAAVINANLTDLYAANGVDANSVDFFYDAFAANGSGIDAVLDSMQVTYNFNGGTLEANVSIEANGNPVNFDYTVDVTEVETSEPTGNGTIPADSTWTLTISGTSSGFPINNPTVEVKGEMVPVAEQDVIAAATDVISGELTAEGVALEYSYDEVSIVSSINGAVGDTVTIDVVGSVKGEVQGFPINTPFDLHYLYERIQ